MACIGSFQGSLFLPFAPKPSSSKSLFAPASVPPSGSWKCYPSMNSVRSKRSVLTFSASDSFTDDLRPSHDEYPEGIISGEWPVNFSLISYDDLRAYLETKIISDKVKPTAKLETVMSTQIRSARPEQTLGEIDHNFEIVSGLPVVDDELRCIGVISKKDKGRAPNGLKSKVSEVMSSPAITLTPDKTVLIAAALMLKKKIHRIPVVNEQKVVGMVTRTDIFQALEAKV